MWLMGHSVYQIFLPQNPNIRVSRQSYSSSVLLSSTISIMMRLLLDVSICFCPTLEPLLVVHSTSLLHSSTKSLIDINWARIYSDWDNKCVVVAVVVLSKNTDARESVHDDGLAMRHNSRRGVVVRSFYIRINQRCCNSSFSSRAMTYRYSTLGHHQFLQHLHHATTSLIFLPSSSPLLSPSNRPYSPLSLLLRTPFTRKRMVEW